MLYSSQKAKDFSGSTHLNIDIVSGSFLRLVLRVQCKVLNKPENLNEDQTTVSLEEVLASKPRKAFRYDDINRNFINLYDSYGNWIDKIIQLLSCYKSSSFLKETFVDDLSIFPLPFVCHSIFPFILSIAMLYPFDKLTNILI